MNNPFIPKIKNTFINSSTSISKPLISNQNKSPLLGGKINSFNLKSLRPMGTNINLASSITKPLPSFPQQSKLNVTSALHESLRDIFNRDYYINLFENSVFAPIGGGHFPVQRPAHMHLHFHRPNVGKEPEIRMRNTSAPGSRLQTPFHSGNHPNNTRLINWSASKM